VTSRFPRRQSDTVEVRAFRRDNSVPLPASTALTAFAEGYADQTERDHRLLLDAIATRRVNAAAG